jgi:anti-anti-sigma factor
MTLKITESRASKEIVLFLSGEINDKSSPQLQSEIFRALKINKNLILDFWKVEAINFAGLQVLRSGRRAAASIRGSFRIQNCHVEIKAKIRNEGIGKILVN